MRLVFTVGVVLLTAGFQPVPEHRTDVPVHPWDLILARPTDGSIAASLLAYKDSDAWIEYGITSGNYPFKTTPRPFTAGEPATIDITGLLAGTRYYYRLRIRDRGVTDYTASEEYSFTTARSPGSTFVFTMQADSHLDENTDPAIYARALENMRADRPDFIVDLGDTFMTDKYTAYKDAQKQYIAQRYYFGIAGVSSPWVLALGNHDGEQGRYLNGTADNMTIWSNRLRKSHFPNPVPGQQGDFYSGNTSPDPIGGPRENYFAWIWGDAHFIVLDPFWETKRTGQSDGWVWTLGSAQYQWLKRTLETSPARYKFVFLHHLVGGKDNSQRGGVEAAKFFEWGGFNLSNVYEFTQKRPGWEMPIHQLLVRHRVSAVFHGHDHLYVKQDLDGIVYQEVPQPGYPRFNQANSAVDYGYVSGVLLGSPGHLRVTVGPDKARVDLVRPVLPRDETATKKNQEIGHSYEIRAMSPVATVSAASYGGGGMAAESIVAAFGTGLATTTKAASSLPLPTEIDGTRLLLRDSGNNERPAPLFFVSPGQINYQVPPGTIAGPATLTVTLAGQPTGGGVIDVRPVSPAIFTADASGKGFPAGTLLRYRGEQQVAADPLTLYDAALNKTIARPIDLGPEGDIAYLVLFGTGIRFRASLGNATATIGGTPAEIVYAGPQGTFVGLDQINIRIPRSLAGRGELDLLLRFDGAPANPVKLLF